MRPSIRRRRIRKHALSMAAMAIFGSLLLHQCLQLMFNSIASTRIADAKLDFAYLMDSPAMWRPETGHGKVKTIANLEFSDAKQMDPDAGSRATPPSKTGRVTSPGVVHEQQNSSGKVPEETSTHSETGRVKVNNTTTFSDKQHNPSATVDSPVALQSATGHGNVLGAANLSVPVFERGGIIIFLHVPKTGGTTIRTHLWESENIEYHFTAGNGQYKESVRRVWYYANTRTSRKRRILFWEIHGRDSPHLLRLNNTLVKLKEKTAQQGIPTFFFSIVREPLDLAVSYFNFFHVQRVNRHFQRVLPTEANLLRFSLYNPQCQFLARGEMSLRMPVKQEPTQEECQTVAEVLRETMDWVGTTERMNEETLVLVKEVIGNETLDFSPELVSSKAHNESVALHQLSPSTISTLRNWSFLDHKLYETIRLDFPFRKWEKQ